MMLIRWLGCIGSIARNCFALPSKDRCLVEARKLALLGKLARPSEEILARSGEPKRLSRMGKVCCSRRFFLEENRALLDPVV